MSTFFLFHFYSGNVFSGYLNVFTCNSVCTISNAALQYV